MTTKNIKNNDETAPLLSTADDYSFPLSPSDSDTYTLSPSDNDTSSPLSPLGKDIMPLDTREGAEYDNEEIVFEHDKAKISSLSPSDNDISSPLSPSDSDTYTLSPSDNDTPSSLSPSDNDTYTLSPLGLTRGSRNEESDSMNNDIMLTGY